MIKFHLKPVNKNIGTRTNKIQKELNKIPKKATEFFKYGAPTPVDTGKARRNTDLRGNEIVANYPYAKVLDDGRGFRDGQMRGSEQAPDGMSKPTLEYIQRTVARVMRGGTI